jgi:hypothetical protein
MRVIRNATLALRKKASAQVSLISSIVTGPRRKVALH